MSFTSYQYYLLLIFAFVVYWAIPSLRMRRRFLVLVSFIFYALWNYRFFGLLVVSATSDYLAARMIASRSDPRVRKTIVSVTMVVNFGLLAFFKYFNFLLSTVNLLAQKTGFHGFDFSVSVALPLGISFYTFHTVSYTIDVYRGKVKPITNFWDYFLFVGYFPQLVAGPIARVTQLYPQFFVEKGLEFRRTADGVLLICFGLLLKIVLADTLGGIAEFVFDKPQLDAWLAWLGVFSFGYQIYVDFWAYTLIARGSSRLFGIELNTNFEQPYLSASPTEFWRRWHMSLSAWFRDYLYIPLGGNRRREYLNLIVVMTIAGLWHGSSVLFILWGFYHGLLLVLSKMIKLPKPLSFVATFLLVNVGWILFRSQTLSQAGRIFRALFSYSPFDPQWSAPFCLAVICIGLTFVVDLGFRLSGRFSFRLPEPVSYLKLSMAGALLMMVVYLGESSATPFIYFNF